MSETGWAPTGKTSAERQLLEERIGLARGVAVLVGLAAIALFLLVGLVAAWFDRRGMGVLWALFAAIAYYPIFKLVSKRPPTGRYLRFLARFFPVAAALLADQSRRQAIGFVAERMENVVAFFRLESWFEAPQVLEHRQGAWRFSAPLKAKLIDDIPLAVGSQAWPGELIARLADCNPTWKPGTKDVLELLYQERLGQRDWTIWKKVRDDEGSLGILAAVVANALARSGRLPKQSMKPWRASDCAAVLADMEVFSWDLLCERLHELASLAAKAVDYLAFLQDNDVALGSHAPPVSELHEISAAPGTPGFVNPEAERDAALLVRVGRTAIRKALAKRNEVKLPQTLPPRSNELEDDLTDTVLRRYARLSALLYLTRRFPKDPAREQLCQDLAREKGNEGVRMAWAYLELKRDFRSEERGAESPFLSISYLVDNWRRKLERSAKGADLPNEIAVLRASLESGEWVNRLSDLIERAQSRRLQPDGGTLTRNDAAQEVLKRHKLDLRPTLLASLFQQVDLETIGRNLETGRFIPYLITFRADRGPLSRLIDCLAQPKKLDDAGIVRIAPYNFRHYTENARIGLVPQGWSFEQFREAFQVDFSSVLAARGTLIPNAGTAGLQGIEVMLHRFSAIGRCAFASPLSRHVALANLKDLLAENLPPEELVALAQSGTAVPIGDYLLGASIPDVVGNEADLTAAESRLLQSRDGQIKTELLGELHLDNVSQLAQRLKRQKIDHQAATQSLAKLLKRHVPQFDGPRSSRVAEVYLTDLEALAAA